MDNELKSFTASQTELPIHKFLGLKIEKISPECVVGSMRVSEASMQPMGMLHGGITALIAEALGSIGGNVASGHNVVGTDVQCKHLRGVKVGSEIIATAKPVRLGRKIQVWEIRFEQVKETTDDEETKENSENKLFALAHLTTSVLSSKNSSVKHPLKASL